MKASVAFGVLVFTLLGIAVATLSPRGDERIAILLDKHRFSEAAAALEKKMLAEKQFNRQVSLKYEIKKLENLLIEP